MIYSILFMEGLIMNYFLGGALMPHPPIMLPEIGGDNTLELSMTIDAVNKISQAIMEKNPKTIIIISPHAPIVENSMGLSAAEYLMGSMAEFNQPDIFFKYKVDLNLAEKFAQICRQRGLPLAAVNEEYCLANNISLEIDKGSLVPLYYLHQAGFKGQIIHLAISLCAYEEMMQYGLAMYNAINDSRTNAVIIVSGDLSHRLAKNSANGYAPEGKLFDKIIIESLKTVDSQKLLSLQPAFIEAAGECGLRSIFFLLGAMQHSEISSQYISYQCPFGVGYGTVLFFNTKKFFTDNSREVHLAKKALEYYLRTGKKLNLPITLIAGLNKKAGVFVSLKKNGQLRGCIGTLLPTQANIGWEIINNAINAGTDDDRFSPVTFDELKDITFSVDVLSPLEPTTKDKLNPQKYGIIAIMKDGRSGVLLPMLPGIDTIEKQLAIVKEKGNIATDEQPEIYRFTVNRYY